MANGAEAPGEPHTPDRVSFICQYRDEPWPCEPAKEDLVRRYGAGSPSLGMYLAAQLNDAAEVLPLGSSEALYLRFLGWARPAGAR